MNVPYNIAPNNNQNTQNWYNDYFDVNPENCENHLYTNVCDNETDIYITVFNNTFFVEYQIKTLRKFFKSPFNLIIVDNNGSLHPENSAAILEICKSENLIYLKSPENYYQRSDTVDVTMKLGTTISWLFHKCVKSRKPKYFGVLDQDCMLTKDIDIRPYLDSKNFYGRVSRSKISPAAWNLHVVVNFFRFDAVKDVPLDFRASYKYQLDTCGANYDVLYHKYNPDEYDIISEGFRYTENNINEKVGNGLKHPVQHYEIIDKTWFHLCASSFDQLNNEGMAKILYAKGFLDSRIQYENMMK